MTEEKDTKADAEKASETSDKEANAQAEGEGSGEDVRASDGQDAGEPSPEGVKAAEGADGAGDVVTEGGAAAAAGNEESEDTDGDAEAEPEPQGSMFRAEDAKHKVAGVAMRFGIIVTCLIGMGASVELARLHFVAHTKPEAKSFCSVNKAINCLNVAESEYAVFLGVPVAIWALLAYLIMGLGTLLTLIKRGRWPAFPGFLILLSVGSVGVAGLMAYISHALIGSLCIVCAGLYAVNIALLVLSLINGYLHGGIVASIKEDFGLLGMGRWTAVGQGALVLAIAGALMAWYPKYWKLNEPAGPGNLPHGVTEDGRPWIGAKNPTLTIYEFSDYQCGWCRWYNAHVRKMLNKKEFRGKIRLVHYHYPLDIGCNKTVPKQFHPRACELARAAWCAQEQGKFWYMQDLLFRRQKRRGGPDVVGLAHKIGLDTARFRACMKSKKAREHIKGDIEAGERMAKEVLGHGIPGTPAFFFRRRGEELRFRRPYEKVLRQSLRPIPDPRGPGKLPHGVTAEGFPWIGAERPVLTIWELSDYQCYLCRVKNAGLRQILKRGDMRRRVRLVHLQYPLDHHCHPDIKQPQHQRACELAQAAVCGREQDKFWEMSDAIYRNQKRKGMPSSEALAKEAGLDLTAFGECMSSSETTAKVVKEIRYGDAMGKAADGKGIDETPTYFLKLRGKKPQRAELVNSATLRKALGIGRRRGRRRGKRGKRGGRRR